MAGVRQQVWARSGATTGTAPVILDLDASLVEIHSENKEGTAANFKHGFGFHPLFCFADATGEALAAMLRPGNATANGCSGSGGRVGLGDRPAARTGRRRSPKRRRRRHRKPGGAGPVGLGGLLGWVRGWLPGAQHRLPGRGPSQERRLCGHRRGKQGTSTNGSRRFAPTARRTWTPTARRTWTPTASRSPWSPISPSWSTWRPGPKDPG